MKVTINLWRLIPAWIFNLTFALVLPVAYNPGQLPYVPGAVLLFFTGAFFSTVFEIAFASLSKKET